MDIELPQFGLMTAPVSLINAAINHMQTLPITSRMVSFILTINQQNMREALCFELYLRHEELSRVPGRRYLAVIAALLSSPDYTHLTFEFFDRVDHVFDTTTFHDVKAEAADVMQRFFPQRSTRMFDILRHHQGEENLNQEEEAERPVQVMAHAMAPQRTHRTIYNDRENVHNSSINNSTISACRALMDMMVSTINFDNKFKVMVKHDDTPDTIKQRLALLLDTDIAFLSIFGNHGQEDHLQSRMTFKINKHKKRDIDGGVVSLLDRLDQALDAFKIPTKKCRFFADEINDYDQLIEFNDYVFPKEMRCDDVLKQRRREEVFIVTNLQLQTIFENECEEEFLFFLDLTGVPDAVMIWIDREQIRKEIDTVMDQHKLEHQTLVDSIFKEIGLGEDSPSVDTLKQNIMVGSVRDIQLVELLNAVWKFIMTRDQSVQDEMKRRLKEELTDGMRVCTTGIAARLVSSIQGFFDEDIHPALKIKMSVDDEIKAKMVKVINDKAIEDDIDPAFDVEDFMKLIDACIDNHIQEIVQEYPDDSISKDIIREMMHRTYHI